MSTHNATKCRFCESGQMLETTSDKIIRHGRTKLIVNGLLSWTCSSCNTTRVDVRQHEINEKLIREAERNTKGYISTAMLKEFREKYSLSQRLAGLLIGAGKSAFGKYESGHHLSAPTAKLIRVALELPQVVMLLAKRRKCACGNAGK